LALWWKGFSDAPFALLGLTAACGATWFLLLALAEADDSPGLFVFGTLLAGFVCVRAAPVRGIHASVAVVFLGGAVIAVVSGFFHLPVQDVTDLSERLADVVYAVGPLLLGSLVARRQVVRKLAATGH
jgi:hypothetical protein